MLEETGRIPGNGGKMARIQFGNSKQFLLEGVPEMDGEKGMYVHIPEAGTEFYDLSAALNGYGGDITVYDENGEKASEYHGYEDKPDIRAAWVVGKDGNASLVYSLYIMRITEKNVTDLNSRIAELAGNAETMKSDLAAAKEDTASALEGVASLFEMMTASADTSTETSTETAADTTEGTKNA
jgi:hypothetical protein